jgi:hypothetical protein
MVTKYAGGYTIAQTNNVNFTSNVVDLVCISKGVDKGYVINWSIAGDKFLEVLPDGLVSRVVKVIRVDMLSCVVKSLIVKQH